MERCSWANVSELDQVYHDTEWGVPVHDDRELFEMLILEGAQAGLSWTTILKKREGYREAFDHFDIDTVAAYDDEKIAELLTNPAIVRNKLKVNGTVTNAKLVLEIQKEFGSFDAYVWSFVGGKPIINHWGSMSDVPATTAESDAMSKAMKKRGFKFVGSTICYAYM
ncbi:DNA-3-methyladenine glycosylase I [Enterovibrio norvegicus]|uniref:DNA-3-methyladenine glycosylase I n=1 Tax=Enterovibrio norvegicus TaxID=188144 RepID=UPI0013D4FBDB|nr:DNA-3-methyladenine glycosylase I [Enterovibrio norvegicus]